MNRLEIKEINGSVCRINTINLMRTSGLGVQSSGLGTLSAGGLLWEENAQLFSVFLRGNIRAGASLLFYFFWSSIASFTNAPIA